MSRPLTNADLDGRARSQPDTVTVAKALLAIADVLAVDVPEVRRISDDFDAGRRPSADVLPAIKTRPRPPVAPSHRIVFDEEVPHARRTRPRWWRRTPTPKPKPRIVNLAARFAHQGVPLVAPSHDDDGL